MGFSRKTAVLGVIFPGIREFINGYLVSLERQTFKGFDVILINDGYGSTTDLKKRYDLNMIEIKYKHTPADIRKLGIDYAKEAGYERLIFADTDDFFAENRVQKNMELLEGCDIVVNDLTLVSKEGRVIDSLYLSNRMESLSWVDFEFIKDKNVFGFTNTSVRLECITEDIDTCGDLVAVDWYLFSRLLKKGYDAVFTNETVTFYRVYGGNTVGLSSAIDGRKIEKGINVKLAHYDKLSAIDESMKRFHESFLGLKANMTKGGFRDRYMEKVGDCSISKPLWWELVRTPEEIGL